MRITMVKVVNNASGTCLAASYPQTGMQSPIESECKIPIPVLGMSESPKIACTHLNNIMCYEHLTCTTDFSKDSTTLKCWVITTSDIAGLPGNSIKYHTLNYNGTQILIVDNFNLLHGAHASRRFYASRGNSRCCFKCFSSFNHF